ncbi:hypothetical protein U9M48_018464 [Paspalum notatum var. saurae]|uniref:Transmembrane protein n=1 Tax=Paspalum notatum var. saurae TaxID=547442 RepID=A0AAQ3TBU3_PASNO
MKGPLAVTVAEDAGDTRAQPASEPRLHARSTRGLQDDPIARTPSPPHRTRHTRGRQISEETMHRSSSYYLQQSSSSSSASTAAAAAAASPGPSGTAGVMDVDHLPTYDPRSDAAKKEALDASRADLARTFVHLIPVVVLLCGLLLWSVSNTDVPATAIQPIRCDKPYCATTTIQPTG